MENNIKVAIRVRPLVEREINEKLPIYWQVDGHQINQILDSKGCQPPQPQSFVFAHHIFDDQQTNNSIFQTVVQPMITSGMAGYNSTVFAYGQTSSGKTHTMLGCQNDRGIIPLTIGNIFEIINNNPERKFLLRLSYIDIYNNSIRDLLGDNQKALQIFEDASGVLRIKNVTETIIHTPDQAHEAITEGEKRRIYATTKINQRSSRSHTIFRIIIESTPLRDDPGSDLPVQVSHLNLVDLAGSERVSQTKATGIQLREGGHINQSLHSLSRVIRQLSTGDDFTSFRDSQLTRILKESLGGNAKTLIIGTITPATLDESVSTLLFISQAKMIENKPVINQVLDSEALTKKYIQEERKLKQELAEMMKNMKDLEERHSRTVNELTKKLCQLTQQFVTSNRTPLKQEEKRRHTMGATTIQEMDSYFTNLFQDNSIPKKLSLPKIQLELFKNKNEERNISDESNNPATPQVDSGNCEQVNVKRTELENLILFGNLEGKIERNQAMKLIDGLYDIFEAFNKVQAELNKHKTNISVASEQRLCSNCNVKQSTSTELVEGDQKNLLIDKPVIHSCTLDSSEDASITWLDDTDVSAMEQQLVSDSVVSVSDDSTLEKQTASVSELDMSSTDESTPSPDSHQEHKADEQHEVNNSKLKLLDENELLKAEIEKIKAEYAALQFQLSETRSTLKDTEDHLLSLSEQFDVEEREKNKYHKEMMAMMQQNKIECQILQLENEKLNEELNNIKNDVANYSGQNQSTLSVKMKECNESLEVAEEQRTEEDNQNDYHLKHSLLNYSTSNLKNVANYSGQNGSALSVKMEESNENLVTKEQCTEEDNQNDDHLEHSLLNYSTSNLKDVGNYSGQNGRALSVKMEECNESLEVTEEDTQNAVHLERSLLNYSTNNLKDVIDSLMNLKSFLLLDNCSEKETECAVLDNEHNQQTEIAGKHAQLEGYIAELEESIINHAGNLKYVENALRDEHQKNLERTSEIINQKRTMDKCNQIDSEENNLLFETNDNELTTENVNLHKIENIKAELIEQRDTLQSIIETENEINIQLMEEVDLLQASYIEQKQMNSNLAKKRDNVSDIVAQAKEYGVTLNAECKACTLTICEQERTNARLAEEEKCLQNKLVRLMEKGEQLATDLNLRQTECTKQTQENANLARKKFSLACKMTELDVINKQLIDENLGLTDKNSKLGQQNSILQEERVFLRDRVAELIQGKSRSTEEKNILQERINELKLINSNLVEENGQLNYKITRQEQLNNNLVRANLLLSSEFTNKERFNVKLIEEKETLQNEIAGQQALNLQMLQETKLLQNKCAEEVNKRTGIVFTLQLYKKRRRMC